MSDFCQGCLVLLKSYFLTVWSSWEADQIIPVFSFDFYKLIKSLSGLMEIPPIFKTGVGLIWTGSCLLVQVCSIRMEELSHRVQWRY